MEVTNEQFVEDAHADGLAVHVWTINDAAEMRMLLGWDADGIMTAVPMRLERVLCRLGVDRPGRAARFGPYCSRRASIACDVVAKRAKLVGKARGRRTLRLVLRRRDEFEGRCAGRVAVKPRRGSGRAVGRFNFRDKAPSEGGPKRRRATVRLRGRMRRVGREGARIKTAARPYGAFVERSRLRVR